VTRGPPGGPQISNTRRPLVTCSSSIFVYSTMVTKVKCSESEIRRRKNLILN